MLTKLTEIKFKEKTLQTTRKKKKIICNVIPIRLSADFSAEAVQARMEWQDIFKVIKGKTYNQDYCTQDRSHSESTEKSKALQTRKS